MEEAIRQILMYQPIRNFSQSVLKISSEFMAELRQYPLPALYALLGATLYGLRHYTKTGSAKGVLQNVGEHCGDIL